jgi:hypothetical protein
MTVAPKEAQEAFEAMKEAAGEDFAEDCYLVAEGDEWHLGCEFGLPYTLVMRGDAWFLRSHHSGEDKPLRGSPKANAESWFG